MPSCPHCPSTGHWSHMQCREPGPHPPHNWSSEFVIYGPYYCKGTGDEARETSTVTVSITYPPGYTEDPAALMNEAMDMVFGTTPVAWKVQP